MSARTDEKAPMRLCCGQRHVGARCPDGMVMCCLCFERFPVSGLSFVGGQPQDVCLGCDRRTWPGTTGGDPA